jgi:hypothetical protein
MRGVFVLGAARSGTSMLTRIVSLLGVPTCVDADLLRARPANPKGFWESVIVTLGDELLLALADGRWWCPPAPADILRRATPDVRTCYRRAFCAVHPTPEWVVKDPRLCFTLPFWREVLDLRPLIVLAVRPPADVAASSTRRTNVPPELTLALWERSMRVVLAHAVGLPVMVVTVPAVLDRLHDWCEEAQEMLATNGFATAGPDWRGRVEAFVEPRLLQPAPCALPLSPSQAALWDLVESLDGCHRSLPLIDLPPETPTTSACFPPMWRGITDHGLPAFGSDPLFGSTLTPHQNELYTAMYHAVAEAHAAGGTRVPAGV